MAYFIRKEMFLSGFILGGVDPAGSFSVDVFSDLLDIDINRESATSYLRSTYEKFIPKIDEGVES